jgi:hypothetical protein
VYIWTPFWGGQIIEFAKNPYNAVVKSPGVDSELLIKHALNARLRDRQYKWLIAATLFVSFLLFTIIPVLIVFLPLLMIVIFIIVLVKHINDHNFVKEHFTVGKFNTTFSYDGPDQHLIHQLQKKTTKNVTYYSGYSPFVGCGVEVGGWSFVIDIDKGKLLEDQETTATPKPFMEDELYYNVSKELQTLKIENCAIENKVYFNGKKIRSKQELLPDIFNVPVGEVAPDFMKSAMNSGVSDARFYKVIQVTGWEGDLVLTAFLRFQKGEKTLFVENNYWLLPPIQEQYRAVDSIKKSSGIRYYFGQFVLVVFKTIFAIIASAFFVLNQITMGINHILGQSPEDKLRRNVKSSPDYDYGSATSIRQMVCQSRYLQHFQKLDKERYLKTIDKRILNGIEIFLDSKDISTAELRERETNVLNNNIIIQPGGTFNGGNVAMGKNAKIQNMFNSLTKGKKDQ